MSIECGFFNSTEGDRLYNAEQIGSFFEGIITDGIYSSVGSCMRVRPYSGMSVGVGTGRAWFDNTWTRVVALEQVQLDASDPILNRIDAICLTVNKSRSVRNNYIEVIKGNGSSDVPQKPEVSSSNPVYRYVLAYVTVNKTATDITSSDIEDMVGTDSCPFIKGIISAEAHVEDSLEEMSEEIDGTKSSISTINTTITNMKSTFQAGVDAVYAAVVAAGITPSASTPDAIAEAISNLRKTPYTGTYKPTARSINNNMGVPHSYRYVDTTAVPNSNSDTYSFPQSDKGETKDLKATNSYRYVNASNVYDTGHDAGLNEKCSHIISWNSDADTHKLYLFCDHALIDSFNSTSQYRCEGSAVLYTSYNYGLTNN